MASYDPFPNSFGNFKRSSVWLEFYLWQHTWLGNSGLHRVDIHILSDMNNGGPKLGNHSHRIFQDYHTSELLEFFYRSKFK